MGKGKKVGGYKEASYDTGGLFGSSTTSENGTSYTPNSYMPSIANSSWRGWQNTLNSLKNGDFSKDKNYQVYSKNLQKQMTNDYNNNVLSNLANNGLMRSSGLQAATNAFNDTMANQRANLYDSYYNRLNNNLANYENSISNLYNYLTGVNTGSQNQANNLNNYRLSKASTNSAVSSADANNAFMTSGLSTLF